MEVKSEVPYNNTAPHQGCVLPQCVCMESSHAAQDFKGGVFGDRIISEEGQFTSDFSGNGEGSALQASRAHLLEAENNGSVYVEVTTEIIAET